MKNTTYAVNMALMTDSYKASHFLQFPKNTKRTFYYMSARVPGEFTKFVGLQMVIKKLLMSVPTMDMIDEAREIWKQHGLPFNYEGWKHIVELGYYPLEIKGIAEGTVVPGDIPLVTITNTDDESAWLPGWVETLLMQLWYPTTVCTKSYNIKQELLEWLKKTGTPEDIMFKLHDFGYRGASSQESAEIGGLSHLVNFMGTDTMAGIIAAQRYYRTTDMMGFSIPAAEHSTMTAWGRENELAAYENMITQFAKPGSIVAVVSDSYDLFNAVKHIWGGALRQKVLDSGATIVIRPDSGEPSEVTLKTLLQLEESFGSTINDKGYKVLNPAVRVIQGDGMSTLKDIVKVLQTITDMGFSADNVAFGMGGGLIQKCDRDTYRFAMKCSAIFDGKEWKDVYKSPVDAPWKASKKGLLDVDADYNIVDTRYYKGETLLRTVYRNGVLLIDDTFEDVRNR